VPCRACSLSLAPLSPESSRETMSQRLFSQVANWLANQFLVERLANARWFQRFAVRTHFAIRDAKATGARAVQEVKANPEIQKTAQQLREGQASASASNRQNAPGWWEQVQREIKSAKTSARDR
jgi:hypothetical protein